MQQTILHNGVVVNDAGPNATALIIHDGAIAFVGSDHDAFALRSSKNNSDIIDLRGAVVMPGLADGHGHLLGLGARLATLQLHDCDAIEEVAARVAQWITAHGDRDWVIGNGWNQERWPDKKFPEKNILDRCAPNTPVYLTRIDGHAALVNSEALRRAQITNVREISGGMIVADEAGMPSGLLIDNAMQLVAEHLPHELDRTREKYLRAAITHLQSRGITMVHDMDVDPAALAIYRKILGEQKFRLRVSSWLRGQNFEWQKLESDHENSLVRKKFDTDFFHVDGIKFYCDGALGSRGALLHAPYHDAPDTCGLELLDGAELRLRVETAAREGYGVAVHAIGDAATHAALNAFESARKKNSDALFRIEHAELIDLEDIGRFKLLNVIASVQPLQRSSDAEWIADRVGDRVARAFPFRELIDAGAALIGGSDFPIEAADSIAGVAAAMYGDAHQRLSLDESVKLFTSWARRGTSFETISGTIAAGMAADLTIIDKNISSTNLPKILGTLVDGIMVYRKEDW